MDRSATTATTTTRRSRRRRAVPSEGDGTVVQLDDETARKLEQMRDVAGGMSATVVARLVFGGVSIQQFAASASAMLMASAKPAPEQARAVQPPSAGGKE